MQLEKAWVPNSACWEGHDARAAYPAKGWGGKLLALHMAKEGVRLPALQLRDACGHEGKRVLCVQLGSGEMGCLSYGRGAGAAHIACVVGRGWGAKLSML